MHDLAAAQNNRQNASDSGIIALLNSALRQDRLCGICEMLRTVADNFGSLGCILWELAPGAEGYTSQDSRLYVLAQWFRVPTTTVTHNLSLDSVTGSAILTHRLIHVEKVSSDQRIKDRHPFLSDADIESFISVPVEFLDHSKGALNVYRQTGSPVFSQSDQDEILQIAGLIPALYGTIRDKLSYRQISDINNIMNQVDMSASMALPTDGGVRDTLQKIVNSVVETFQPIEVSLYLKNSMDVSPVYDLAASNLQDPRVKAQYRASVDDGITGWVLAKGKNVRLFDFNFFELDKGRIRKDYPEMEWLDSLGVQSLARARLGLREDEPLPPLSFMSCPVLLGSNVLGAIRCTATTREPNYYSERELGLLQLIAAQIGHFWATWLNRCELEQENASWRNLIAEMSRTNELVQKFVKQRNPDVYGMLHEAMAPIGGAIPGGESFELWLANEKRTELSAIAAGGRYFNALPLHKRSALSGRKISIVAGAGSLGSMVMETGQIKILDVERGQYPSELFPDTTQVLAVPVTSEEGVLGVLYVQNRGDETFGEHAALIAQLVAQQLGLYYSLANTMGRRYRAENEQLQTFEDLQHQLKTPIQQAHARMQIVLQSDTMDDRLRLELHKVRGLCAKVKRVAMSLKLFSDLSKNHPIDANRSRLTYDGVVKMLIEAASDNALMVEAKRQIRFTVERESFRVLTTHNVELDQDLLEQAMNNLLDNAGKYSYSNTTVRIFGGITGKGRLHLSVANKGIPIRAAEAGRIRERGYRTEDAQATGDGTGIGLWMVEHIMQAHKGQLLVIASNADGMTEMKLIFPIEEGGR